MNHYDNNNEINGNSGGGIFYLKDGQLTLAGIVRKETGLRLIKVKLPELKYTTINEFYKFSE